MPDPIALTAAALLIEAGSGYPAGLFRSIRHPVVWMGALISALDRTLNDGTRWRGVVALVLLLVATGVPAVAVTVLVPHWALLAVLAASLPAQRSLHAHVGAVGRALRRSLPEARAAVAHIVGRDPERLDSAGIARAAIESLAENFSDGVVGPAVWGCAGGLPGMALYKAVNTADSMIGHRTARHERFGWASARFDDLVNLPASRLAAAWIVVAAALVPGARAGGAWVSVWRDAGRHRSPNAGWPEAAMAGALGLRLAGPRSYRGVRVEDGWMGDGRAEATAEDVERALGVYRVACGLQIGVMGVMGVAGVIGRG